MSQVNPAFNDGEVIVTSFTTKHESHQELDNASDAYETIIATKKTMAQGEIPAPYAGMPREVLLHYSRQRKFVWTRNILAGITVFVILLMISLVIAIIAISPACLEFWQTSPIYQIYPKSFKSTGNHSYGDLKGIQQKLDYLNDDLGVKVLWLNPVYASPQSDSGYDIKDFRDVDPIFGTMEDMDDLIAEMHNRGMKIVMDFIPNHSSEEHEWFIASSDPSHEDHEKYKDYYIWVNGTQGTLPNNWQTMFLSDPDAWTWSSTRGQYYYHAFYRQQPDLNLRNQAVRNELKDILRFWLKKGIDGFRCGAVMFMYEADHLQNNPLINETRQVSRDNMHHYYTQEYSTLHDLIAEWREVLDEYSTEPGVYRFMETEAYADIRTTMRYYGTGQVDEADFPMNFLLVGAEYPQEWTSKNIMELILSWMKNMPEGKWPNWVVSNHDNSRLPTRVGNEMARSAAFLIMTLPGTPGMYYGDEIGMTDNIKATGGDFRDPERAPMQWSSESNAGFCEDCIPWLPVNDDYTTVNVEYQLANSTSMLSLYKRLISLRSEWTFQRGHVCMLQADQDVLVYIRELSGLESYLIAINFGNTARNLDLSINYKNLPNNGRVVLDSLDSDNKASVDFSSLSVLSRQSLAVKYSTSDGNMFSKNEAFADLCFVYRNVCFNNALTILQTC